MMDKVKSCEYFLDALQMLACYFNTTNFMLLFKQYKNLDILCLNIEVKYLFCKYTSTLKHCFNFKTFR